MALRSALSAKLWSGDKKQRMLQKKGEGEVMPLRKRDDDVMIVETTVDSGVRFQPHM